MSERLIITRPHYFVDSKSQCGYCSGQKERDGEYYCLGSWDKVIPASKISNCTVGFQAELMSVQMYGRLCDMGYRRSGKFLYKCDMLRNCCRLYTIRTASNQFSISKDFKSTLKKFRKQVCPPDDKRGNISAFNFINEIIETETNSDEFKTCFGPAVFTEEKYQLFAKYQEQVHDDFKHNPKSFKRFLCDSPFSKEVILGTDREWKQLNNWKSIPSGEKLERLGPAHECYYFRDKLIAIAVIDFLPSGISSVYFIWDPDYYKWSLGKVSALRELCITKKANLGYYYMGYYIDDCPKMNYKAKYGGELLDVCTQRYLSLSQLNKLKSSGKLFTLSDGQLPASQGEVPLNDALTHPARTLNDARNIENIAERVYGPEGSAYEKSNEAARHLSSVGIPYAVEDSLFSILKDDEDDHQGYTIPNVVPGLVPLKEILGMVLHGEINKLEGDVTLFDMYKGDIRLLHSFAGESPEVKKVICDVVRVIGLENTRGVLLLL